MEAICKLFFSLLITLIPTTICGQIIYTPQGTKLPTDTYSTRSEELSSSQKIALKDHYEQHYPRAIYFDEATTTYNSSTSSKSTNHY